MSFLDLLAQSPTALILCTLVLGLLVGSFLNVVIYRTPAAMMSNWRREARDILELPAEDEPSISIVSPASRCPQCQTPIAWYHNIPVVRSEERRVGKGCR